MYNAYLYSMSTQHVLIHILNVRAESKRYQMARDLKERDNHLKEYIMALTKFIAAMQVLQ